MIDFIQNLDIILFYFVNNNLSNSFFDLVMPFLTEVDNWLLIYIFGFYYLIFKCGKVGRITAAALILTIILSDQISSTFIKEYIGRLRPCHTLPDVNLLVGCGGGKSFPSSHAANNFAAATVITYFFRKNYSFFYIIAAVVAFTRIYIGVHYPFDVIGGAVLGVGIGFLTAFCIDLIFKKIPFKKV